ncbi:hypothetical protein LCGC14_2034160, partial [marine sediment metagenome]
LCGPLSGRPLPVDAVYFHHFTGPDHPHRRTVCRGQEMDQGQHSGDRPVLQGGAGEHRAPHVRGA